MRKNRIFVIFFLVLVVWHIVWFKIDFNCDINRPETIRKKSYRRRSFSVRMEKNEQTTVIKKWGTSRLNLKALLSFFSNHKKERKSWEKGREFRFDLQDKSKCLKKRKRRGSWGVGGMNCVYFVNCLRSINKINVSSFFIFIRFPLLLCLKVSSSLLIFLFSALFFYNFQ